MRKPAWLLVVSLAFAQIPVVGDINFYGLHKITPQRIANTLYLRNGGPLPRSKGELEDTLTKLPGIVLARVEAVCCEGPRVILFIGIEERGAAHPAFRSEPAGEETLPQELVDSYDQYLAAVQKAAAHGNAAEDLSAGHAILSDPEARAFQLRFASFAEGRLPLLRGVLRNCSLLDQRAIAAAVIGYAPKKRDVVDDLQFALQDPEGSVRVNAMRSLKAIAVLALREPSLGIRISPTWALELLNSVVLSDRVEAAGLLVTLTDGGDPLVLQMIRERSLDTLAEMARWKTPRYALPPFLLLGRAAGLADPQIQQSWERGDRDSVIDKALATAAHKGA